MAKKDFRINLLSGRQVKKAKVAKKAIATEKPAEKKPSGRRSFFISFGASREDKDYFLENLALLMESGMNLLLALRAIKEEVRSSGMRRTIKMMEEEIESGSSLWETILRARLFSSYVISLIRIGEQTGRLDKNLKLIAESREKERAMSSKIRSAMIYPALVISLTIIIGLGVAWYLLPRLAMVFASLNVKVPAPTRVLIAIGDFMGAYGATAVPATLIFIFLSVYFIFFFKKTKFIGQATVLRLPGIKRMVKEAEIARFGFIFGNLIDAGLPIEEAIQSLSDATELRPYKKFYLFLKTQVVDGVSFEECFDTFKKINYLFPAPVRQMIIAGEQSGRLSDTLIKIGANFEEKSSVTAKNLAVILEPLLLIIIWLGVASLALAVILPIYGLIGGMG